MRDRKLYLGAYNSPRDKMLFNMAIDHLRRNKGNKFYYILANGNMLEQYRRRMIREVNGAFDMNLFTFDDIVNRLLKSKSFTCIDDEIKEALLIRITKELSIKGKLRHYQSIADKRGFSRSLISIIGEIKRSLITADEYLTKCPNEPFYLEIGYIYKEYEDQLNEHGLVDREEGFIKSLELLKEDNSFFDGLDFIIIDGFFDFRPQELGLFKEIAKTNCNIYINMPFNRDSNFSTLLETIDYIKELGFEIVSDRDVPNYYEKLAGILFDESMDKLESNQHISVIKAANNYLEIKKISEQIKRHYIEGTDLKDIGIVLTNMDEYKQMIFRVFEEEQIPCSLDKDMNLIQVPLIKELICVLKIKENTKRSIINRIKNDYFSVLTPEKRESTEYLLRKTDFSTISELMQQNNCSVLEYASEPDSAFSVLEKEMTSIPTEATILEYKTIVSNFIAKYNIAEKILDNYNATKDFSLFLRDTSALNKLNEILNTITIASNVLKDNISLNEFMIFIESYFNKQSIKLAYGDRSGISILTPVTIRGQKFKVLFIVGLSQGNYPKLLASDFFFKDDNYKKLKSIGINVKNYYQRLDKESLIFTTAIAACTSYLYLSYSENITSDEKDIPSLFLEEALNCIKGNTIKDKISLVTVDMDYLIKHKLDQITTKRDLSKYLLESYYEDRQNEELFSMHNSLDGDIFKEVNKRILCEAERDKGEFGKYNGNIGEKNIIRDIKNIHENKLYSISYLESYGRCPYYFLLNNILKVEQMERELEDFTPLDRGKINHEVLKEYYYNFRKAMHNHIMGGEAFNASETYDYVLNRVKAKLSQLTTNIDSRLWQLRIENNADKLLAFVESDLNRLTKSKLKAIPFDFEVIFGGKEPFEIEIDDYKILFTGAIDRLDKLMEEDKYIIIDYKNSNYNIRDIDHMKTGLSLQLPLYVLSQRHKAVIGAMYGIISTGEFQIKIGDAEEKGLIHKSNKGAITEEGINELLELTKQRIKSYIEGIYGCEFSVNPSECSPYCIYKDICRYKGIN